MFVQKASFMPVFVPYLLQGSHGAEHKATVSELYFRVPTFDVTPCLHLLSEVRRDEMQAFRGASFYLSPSSN